MLTRVQVQHLSETASPQEFTIWRRFSDFDDVHRQLRAKFPALKLAFPEKTLFSNHSTEFITKRKAALAGWLTTVLQPEFMDNKDVREVRALRLNTSIELARFWCGSCRPRRMRGRR